MEPKDVTEEKYVIKFVWPMVLLALFIAIGVLTGIYCLLFEKVLGYTYIFTFTVFILGGLGLGPGAHRYFCHRSYKTNRAVKLFMIVCQQLSGIKSIHSWVRVHRAHHKFADTDKDPTSMKYGLFHAAIGWFLIKQTPEAQHELDRIYMDDVIADNDLNFQLKYYPILYTVVTIALPSIVPYYFWNESLLVGFGMNMFRYGLNIYQQIVGNSFLHLNGRKPYDGSYTAIDNDFYNLVTLGEGYHNFHHAFPFDYRANELFGLAHITSLSNLYINVLAALGLVYDRKFASPQMIARRVTRTGDGSHPLSKAYLNDSKSWGNGEPEMHADDE
ncbi:delta(9)-fatty-acid desaturase fat-6-like [Chironomus tepperi]|uniref:delta(9)-fatty-acid desaturase fat-6-like n=1 Tax=Chironomus tepperi TaxID=113505 RepID=UPI00391EE94E